MPISFGLSYYLMIKKVRSRDAENSHESFVQAPVVLNPHPRIGSTAHPVREIVSISKFILSSRY
jgi:hypothetical protein